MAYRYETADFVIQLSPTLRVGFAAHGMRCSLMTVSSFVSELAYETFETEVSFITIAENPSDQNDAKWSELQNAKRPELGYKQTV